MTESSTPIRRHANPARKAGHRDTGSPSGSPTPPTWPAPDATHLAENPRYGRIQLTAWHGLHPKLARRSRWADTTRTPIVTGTVIRIEVEHLPKPTGRAKKTLWLWWAGPTGTTPDLDLCWRAYIHRFDAEDTLRFAKNTLGPTTPALRTPEQADRCSWLILASYGSRADSSPTSNSPGNDHETQPSSHPPGCDGDFAG